MSEEEYILEESVKKFGRLVPIIKDANGNIIDGDHRVKLDPKWAEEFSVTLDHIKDPIQRLLARMQINLARRKVSPEEKTKWLKELAKITQWSPKEIAENTKFSYSWVMKYLPDELKDKEMSNIGKLGGEAKAEVVATRRVAEAPVAVQCSCCPMGTLYPKEWKGQPVCPSCFDKLSRGEITLKEKFEPKPKEKTTRVEKRVYESGAWKETMEQPVSRMDEAVRDELQRLDIPYKFQEPICIKTVIPDIIIMKGDRPIAVFLDGEVHLKREETDTENRELLTKRGFRVLQLKYDAFTEEQKQAIMSNIMDIIK